MIDTNIVIPLALVPLLLIAQIYLFSRASGWQTLARRYPLRGPFPPPKTRMGDGVFRGWIGYNGGIVVASDHAGLYLRAMPVVLSFCHDPIFIPWSDVTRIARESGALARGFRIATAQAPEVRFALRASTFALVRADAQAAGVTGRF
ncbi:MAG: hypothetical protein U1F68_14610 [Gammaproteobacteria bacterium]